MKRHLFLLILAACAVAALASVASGQFISDDQDKGQYQNYSGRNYENYSTTVLRRKFYDNFGNFLVDGVSVFDLNEQQRPFTNYNEMPLSSLTKTRFYFNYFSNLLVMNDSYGGFTSRLMIGDAIRTKFTSLTLDKARFNGIRWDGSTNKYRGSIVASRVSDPIRFAPEGTFTSSTQRRREWADYLLGGHFETDLGDVMTIGATYVNQHQQRSTQDSKLSSIEGTPAAAVPRVIFVKIMDDSPGDNSGPIVFAPPQIYINGSAKAMTNINGAVPDPAKVDLKFPIHYWTMRDYHINYVAGGTTGASARDTISTTQYVSYRDFSNRYAQVVYPFQLPSENVAPAILNTAYSDHNITYAFVIPPGVYSVEFSVVLSNDFRIDANHDWINNVEDYSTADRYIPFRSHGDSLVNDPVPVPTIWRTMANAEGNVKDGSNRQVVRFSYGLVSGVSVYSVNFKFNYAGFKLEGEYANSAEFLKYPVSTQYSQRFLLNQTITDNRFNSPGEAYYLRGTKKIGRVTFGFERYRMDKRFTSMFNHYTLDNSFYGDQNTPDTYPDYLGFDGSAASATFPGSYIPGRAGGASFAAVDDNDDNDRWEDGTYHYNVDAIPSQNGDVINYYYQGGFPGSRGTSIEQPFNLGYRQNLNELTGLSDIIRKPDAGIFPGRDKDRDGIPDDDKNSDGVPDYVQDFLTYYADPPFFNYGDDWNNNGVIDEQENDILPDYPYNQDLNGYHVFGTVELMRNMNLRIGKIHDRAMIHGGRNFSDYLRWTYEAGTPKFGNINLFYVMKRVEDNIPNNGYQYINALTTTTPIPDFVFDPLEYKNSLAHQIYVGTIYRQIPDVNIENNIRFEFNQQYALGTGLRDRDSRFLNPDDQLDGQLEKLGIVSKIDYTIPFFNGRLKVIPQFKVRYQRIRKEEVFKQIVGLTMRDSTMTKVVAEQEEVIPILRMEYRLTDRTDLHIGIQGVDFNGLGKVMAYQIMNIKDPQYDENRTTVALAISNRSSYGGYNVVVDFGLKQTFREFPRTLDLTMRERQESLIYMSVYAGF